MTVLLEQRFGKEAKFLIEEGQVLYSAYLQRAKEAVSSPKKDDKLPSWLKKKRDSSEMVETL
jgi:hypothetical protein